MCIWNEAAGLCRALSLLTVGMATLTFFRLTRWAGFGAVAATVSVVALRNAAVILNHAVTIGVSAILFGHTNTLFLSRKRSQPARATVN